MTHKFRVTIVESERGWGRKTEYDYFDTVEEAIKFRDHINSFNEPVSHLSEVPDWYMYAEKEITVVEQ